MGDLFDPAERTISGDVDDASLLRDIQRGGRAAFAALYDRHAPAAFGLAVKITGDRGIAEDVVQDAFLALWKQAPRFDPARGQVRSWLLTIVHHRAVEAFGKARDLEGEVGRGHVWLRTRIRAGKPSPPCLRFPESRRAHCATGLRNHFDGVTVVGAQPE